MIRPLRRLHRGGMVVLGLVVPAGLLLALRARVEIPTNDSPLPLLGPAMPETDGRDLSDIWTDVDVETRVWSEGWEGAPLLLLAPRTDLRRPDVLLYWEDAATVRAEDDQPAPTARLLGSVAGTAARIFALPGDARTHDGRLVLYSMAHRAILHTATLPALED